MPNVLVNEKSLYLRQHSNNPVEWYPWNQDALDKAKNEDKPILLSIGYSACHWCHVMANESFTDNSIGIFLNKNFINIKVDREERPDLDKIYQRAYQLLNKRGGGWPLTVFLSPHDLSPFFIGTYFPPVSRHGLPSFIEVLKSVCDFYYSHSAELQIQGKNLKLYLDEESKTIMENTVFNILPLDSAKQELIARFDRINGGFEGAPKFPHVPLLDWLLTKAKDEQINQHLNLTLAALDRGGIHDHLGGGFFRYSVDDHWEIPHFEKMLYDNALLLCLFAEVYGISKDAAFAKIVHDISNWLYAEMQDSCGGFYAAINADSEHEEGKFYVWDTQQFRDFLSQEEYSLYAKYFNVEHKPNFEGKWHLFNTHNISSYDLTSLEIVKNKLLSVRNLRVRPSVDHKILTAWNALLLKGFVKAAQYLNNSNYLNSAHKIFNHIKSNMWQNETLLACYAEGIAYQKGFLDDYVFLLDALLALLELEWRQEYLDFAIRIAEKLLLDFYDSTGGFYFTPNHQQNLLYRSKQWQDEVIPSGNGIAVFALQRLGYLLNENRYLDAVQNTLKAAWNQLENYSSYHPSLLKALEEHLNPPRIIFIRGENIEEMKHWQRICHKDYDAHTLCFVLPNNDPMLPDGLKLRPPTIVTTAYICVGTQCCLPITNSKNLLNHFKIPYS